MMQKTTRRFLAALMAAVMLLTAASFAAAESGNPFDAPAADAAASTGSVAASASDPTAVSSPDAAGQSANTGVGVGVDLFNTAAPAASVAPVVPAVSAAPVANTGAVTTDPFGVGSSTGTSATDPFGVGTSTGTSAADPFGVGTSSAASIGSTAGNDPFGTATATGTIGGYNPFDPDSAAATTTMNQVMFVTASSLKVLREPQEGTRTLTTATFGQQLTVTAVQGEWAKVQNDKGVSGYCQLSALSTADPNTMSRLMYAQLKRVPVYQTPVRRSRRLRYLKQGETVTMVAITSDGMWARVSDSSGKFGFIPTIYLDDAPAAQGTPVWCSAGSASVMVNPENWIDISTVSFGQQLYLLGYLNNNTVAKVRTAKGYVAYCDASVLSTSNPATMNTPMYTQVSGRILYKSASKDGKTLNVGKNVRVTLLGVDQAQEWGLVKYRGRQYYIPYLFLGANRLGRNYRIVVTTQETTIYGSTSVNPEIVATVPQGTRMYLASGAINAVKVATIQDANNTQRYVGYVTPQNLRGE